MYKSLNRPVQFASRRLKFYKQLLFAAAMLLGCLVAQAQTIFPVQSTTRILPPYSVYLADYAVNGNDKLQCILVNRDATQQTYQVRLRLTIKLNGTVIMRTSETYNPSPITLTPSMAMVFAGATLEPYLKSENLDFVGYSQELYEANRALPEGFYEIGFAAFDYYRQDVQVSNDGWGFYFLAKNEPPLINMPSCGSKLQPQYSTPIRFSWLPRNTASLNSSNTTIYRYFLYEVNPQGTNPNDIVNSLPPVYIDSTPVNQTFYDLMPTTTLLRDSFVYAWRVQAVDINGADLFRNNGFSEVCTFTWGGSGSNPYGSIDSVLNLNAIGETERKGKMWWTKDVVKFDGYKVHYKKAGNGYNWFTKETDSDTLRVLDLEPDTEYECRLQGRKNGSYGMYSDVRYFRTKKLLPPDCNNITEVPITTSGQPMTNMPYGTVITYRDFQVRVTDSIVALPQPGHFSGKGEISLPFLAGLTFAVRFDDITVDHTGTVSAGNIHFITTGDIVSWWIDQINEQAGGNDVGDVITGNSQTDYTSTYPIASPGQINAVLPLINGVTNIIITRPTPPGGYDTVKNVPLPYTIQDSNGNIYSVDETGNVVKVGQKGSLPGLNTSTLNNIQLDKAKVTFKPHPAQVYAFDEWQSGFAGKNIVEREYEKLTDNGTSSNYYVSNKAIGAAKSDKVIAKIEIIDNQYKADSIKFATRKGVILTATATSTAGEYSINLIGGPAGDAQELYALYPKAGGGFMTLGKLKIVAYGKITKDVVLVPVTDSISDLNDIRTQLSNTYKPYNIDINLVMQPKLLDDSWDIDGDKALDIEGSGILSQNTIEMKKLNQVYAGNRIVQPGSIYIFILKESKDNQSVEGDMPRASKFGYIFTRPLNGNTVRISRTLAHEIGHGVFNLLHIFDNTIGFTSGTTDNLMDYGTGDILYKFQWDQLHDPGIVDKIFEQDEDNLSLMHPQIKCIHDQAVVQSLGKVFKDNRGRLVRLQPDETPYAFFGPKEGGLYGHLAGFRKAGKTYIYLLQYDSQERDYVASGRYGASDNWSAHIGLQELAPGSVTPAMAMIGENKKVNGVIQLANCGCPDLEQVLGQKNPDKTLQKGGKDGSGAYIDIKDFSNLLTEAEKERLKKLFGGKDKKKDANGVESRTSKVSLFITSGTADLNANKATIEAYQPAFTEIMIWIHLTNGTPEVKLIKFGDEKTQKTYAENLTRLNETSPTFWQKFFANWPQASLEDMMSVLYEGLDWMCKQISKAKIPEYVWNCNSPDFDPEYSRVFNVILKPVTYISDAVIEPYLADIAPQLVGHLGDARFAMMCGVWNGFVDMVGAIPEGLKLLVSAGSNQPGQRKELEALKREIQKNGGGFKGFSKTLWNGLKEAHDINVVGVCGFSHTIGSDIFMLVAAYFTAGESLVATTAGRTVRTVLMTLERLDIVGQAIAKGTGLAFNITFSGGKKVLNFILPGAGQAFTNVYNITKNAIKYRVEIWDAITNTWKNIDWATASVVQLENINGTISNATVWARNIGTFNDGILKIKEILKDENGQIIRSEAMDILVNLENQAGQTTVATVKQGNNLLKRLYNTIPEMVAAIKSKRGNIFDNCIRNDAQREIAEMYFGKWEGVDFTRVPQNMDFDEWYRDIFKNGYAANSPAFQAHHIIPINILETNAQLKNILKWADDQGLLAQFEFNGLDNGIAVQTKRRVTDVNGHGNHPRYDDNIEAMIADVMIESQGNYQVAFDLLREKIDGLKARIKNEVILGDKDINTLVF